VTSSAGEDAVIDHLSTYASDFPATLRLYDAALKALGYSRVMELVATWDPSFPTRRMSAYGPASKPVLWIVEVPPKDKATPRHLALAASTRAAVDAFYRAAIAAGGRDNGAPGLRPDYHENYYGAFVLDPDGNNVEAVCHSPA
jgi:catechol 2,3-dioxygenase-like lactoylglutathione lyase family enzyme